MELVETPHRFTVEEYMALDIEARTELLGGLIYDVSPRNEPHRFAVRALDTALVRGLDPKFTVQIRDAVAIDGWRGREAPEVDVAVLLTKIYHPGPIASDVVALIEVCDTTYAADRRYKIPLYVSAGITSYIVNIPLRRVERYVSLSDLEAPHGIELAEGDAFDIAGVEIAVATLFV